MCDLCPAREPLETPIDWCTCPLWEPCVCSREAPLARGYADAQPWRVEPHAVRDPAA